MALLHFSFFQCSLPVHSCMAVSFGEMSWACTSRRGKPSSTNNYLTSVEKESNRIQSSQCWILMRHKWLDQQPNSIVSSLERFLFFLSFLNPHPKVLVVLFCFVFFPFRHTVLLHWPNILLCWLRSHSVIRGAEGVKTLFLPVPMSNKMFLSIGYFFHQEENIQFYYLRIFSRICAYVYVCVCVAYMYVCMSMCVHICVCVYTCMFPWQVPVEHNVF